MHVLPLNMLFICNYSEGSAGDRVPWPERRGVLALFPSFCRPPQAAREEYLNSYIYFMINTIVVLLSAGRKKQERYQSPLKFKHRFCLACHHESPPIINHHTMNQAQTRLQQRLFSLVATLFDNTTGDEKCSRSHNLS